MRIKMRIERGIYCELNKEIAFIKEYGVYVPR